MMLASSPGHQGGHRPQQEPSSPAEGLLRPRGRGHRLRVSRTCRPPAKPPTRWTPSLALTGCPAEAAACRQFCSLGVKARPWPDGALSTVHPEPEHTGSAEDSASSEGTAGSVPTVPVRVTLSLSTRSVLPCPSLESQVLCPRGSRHWSYFFRREISDKKTVQGPTLVVNMAQLADCRPTAFNAWPAVQPRRRLPGWAPWPCQIGRAHV